MVSSCCIKGCKSKQYPGCQKSFHKFPSDEKLRKKWIEITGCKENVHSKRICPLHFKKEDFIIYTGRIRLRRNVVPFYVNPPFKMEPDVESSVVKNIVYQVELDQCQGDNDDKQMKSNDNRDEVDTSGETKDEIDDLQENAEAQINKVSREATLIIPRCAICFKSRNLSSIWREHCVNGNIEVYGDMLVFCFALSISKPVSPSEDTGLICESCIMRLKDAINFKTEVSASELVLNVQKKSETSFISVKQENEDTIDVESNYNNFDDCDDLDKFNKKVKEITDSITQDSSNGNNTCSTIHTDTDAMAVENLKHLAPESIRRAVKAVSGHKTSEVRATNKSNVTTKATADPLNNELTIKMVHKDENFSNVAKREKTTPLKTKKKQTYPTKNLLKAVEDVWNRKITQTQASKLYQVPRSTIFDLLTKNYGKPPKMEARDHRAGPVKTGREATSQEMVKHTTNFITITENSNATPIRCHGDGGYACCFCDQRYHVPGELKTHTIYSHDANTKRTFTKGKRPSSYFAKLDITSLKCTICNTDIETLENLIDHLINDHQKIIHTDIKNQILPFKFDGAELRCVVCGNFFNKFKALQEHLSVHYPNYVCRVCNAGFVSRMILYNHSRGHDTGVFECDQCPKVYDTQRKLRSHQSLVHRHSNMVSKCGYCNERFKSYHKKLVHLTRVHNLRRTTFSCKACDRSFSSQAGLRIHRRRDHLMERKYKCTECDMKFFAKAALDTHMLKHGSERSFQCDVCKKSYKRKNTLREHLRIHENNRRFKCEQCGAAFVQKCSWQGHMRRKHAIIG